MTLTYECPECQCEIEVEFEPAVAPTIRMDPNDCDAGDPGCCDHPAACPCCREPLGDLWDWCVRQVEHKRDDALERQAEDRAEQKRYGRY